MQDFIQKYIVQYSGIAYLYNCYNYPNTKIKAGDLVFYQPKNFLKSNFISAITESSPTDMSFYHVAMVARAETDVIELIEADSQKGVIVTEHKNICNTHGLFSDVEVSRANLPDEEIKQAIDISINLVGSEYNDLFSPDFINSKGNKSFYCSQIIQYAFNLAALNNIFPDIPMSFRDSKGEISNYWKEYYATRLSPIPQDEPGTHPASIYESEFLTCF